MNLEDIPTVRCNPVIADIFAQLGYMERKGSGMGKIINPIKALPYFEEKMLPTFLLTVISIEWSTSYLQAAKTLSRSESFGSTVSLE